MQNKKQISVYLAMALMVAAVMLGYALSAYSQHEHTTGKNLSGNDTGHLNLSFINPLLEYADLQQLDYSELKSFKGKIEKGIARFHLQNPQVQVSYYFRDLNNGLWTGIGEDKLYSPASLFKLPLLMAVLKKSESDPAILDMGFTYHAADFKDVKEESGFKKTEGQYYTVRDLMKHMIAYSDNGAALMLMNTIGDSTLFEVMDDLNFHVEKGFNENTAFVNVKSYAALFRILYNGSYLSRQNSVWVLQMLSESVYHEGVRKGIPQATRIAHKYGKRDHWQGAELQSRQLHHFALVYHPRKPFIIGIMTQGGDLLQKEKLIEELTRITWDEVDQQTQKQGFHGLFAE